MPRHLRNALALAVILAAPVLFASVARGDCAEGSSYNVTVTGNTVQICLVATTRVCGDSGGMLRQDSDTGAVVRLADYCGANGTLAGKCYVDECVPKGSYRYGFATPYDCTEAGCGGVAYWLGATVASDLGTCTRASADAAPTTYAAAVPWPVPAAKAAGAYKQCSGVGCSTAGTGTLIVQGGLALAALAWMHRRRRAFR